MPAQSFPRTLVVSLLLLVAATVVPATAAAMTASAARDRLHDAQQLARQAAAGTAPANADLSATLAAAASVRGDLDPASRRQLDRLLARPTDGKSDPDHFGWSVLEATASPACSAHFCVHWVATGKDRPALRDRNHDGVPDYVALMATDFEVAYRRENGLYPAGLAWPVPRTDGVRGGNAKTDVYIEDLGRQLYGLTAPEPATRRGASMSSYLLMDNDYRGLESGVPPTAAKAVLVTSAHEYNHVLHNTFDFRQDAWMFEATAVWMEEQVHPAIDDWHQYLDDWANLPLQPLTTFADDGPAALKPYGAQVWSEWLSSRHGPDVIRAAWAASPQTDPSAFAPLAYDQALRTTGAVGFADEFARFEAATAEWKSLTGIWADAAAFPDMKRSGNLAGGTSTTVSIDHTAAIFLDVPTSTGTGGSLTATATFPAGVAGAVSLVARTTDGKVLESTGVAGVGGAIGATLDNPGNLARVTLVLTNASIAQSGFNRQTGDWSFTQDKQSVSVALTTGVLAVDTTPPSGLAVGAPTHAIGNFTGDRVITATAIGAFDDISGIAGYSVAWDQSPSTVPDATIDTTSTSFVSPPLPDGTSWVHVRAIDALGNASGTATAPFRVDTSPPGPSTLRMLETAGIAEGTSLDLTTSSSDPQSGIGAWAVTVRQAAPGRNFGPVAAWAQVRTAQFAFDGSDGTSYCLRTRAINVGGVASPRQSPEACGAVPFDDRRLAAAGGFQRVLATTAFHGTLSRSVRKGATLSRAMRGRTVALLARRCPGCGSVQVTFNGKLLKTVSLAGRAHERVVVPITRFDGVRSGTVRIITTGTQQVLVDGLGVGLG